MTPWTVRKSRYLLHRWWMRVREDHVVLPSGVELPEFHVVEYPDWACAICLTEEGDLVLVEQYRHGIGKTSLEFPAGAVNPGEDPLKAAKRELEEETGYAAEEWIPIGRCAPEPSKHTNYAHLYFARGARRVTAPSPDESESLQVRLMSVREVYSQAMGGRIFHGIHLTALYWAVCRGLLPEVRAEGSTSPPPQ